MCTVSASFEGDTYSLLFNRDEQLTRPIARPPRHYSAVGPDSVPFLAPLDPQGGGTWLAVNEAGIIVGLLNRYPEPGTPAASAPDPGRVRSRGLLVRNLAGCTSLTGIESALREWDLDPYPPFLIFAAHPASNHLLRLSWDRVERDWARDSAAPWFLATSGVQPARVTSARSELYRRQSAAGTPRLDIHLGCNRIPGHEEIRMHREDARTVSVSHLLVSGTDARFQYFPVEKDILAPREVRLPLRQPA